jgi:hypothetical protein
VLPRVDEHAIKAGALQLGMDWASSIKFGLAPATCTTLSVLS